MNRLPIYKSNPFYPSRTLIFYSIILSLFIVAIIAQEITGTHENLIFQYSIFLSGLVFIVGQTISFLGLRKTKPLYGKIIGYVSFTKKEIIVCEEVFQVTDIKKIEFEGVDWLGLYDGYQTFSFENKLSNGTKNWMIIKTKSSVIKVRFQKKKGCVLSELKEEFMEYYKLGKISYLQLIDNLCINSTEEQKELKSRKL